MIRPEGLRRIFSDARVECSTRGIPEFMARWVRLPRPSDFEMKSRRWEYRVSFWDCERTLRRVDQVGSRKDPAGRRTMGE